MGRGQHERPPQKHIASRGIGPTRPCRWGGLLQSGPDPSERGPGVNTNTALRALRPVRSVRALGPQRGGVFGQHRVRTQRCLFLVQHVVVQSQHIWQVQWAQRG